MCKGAFQIIDLDRSYRCNYCFGKTKVSGWKCMCNLLWHTCTVHARYGNKRTGAALSSVEVAPMSSSYPRVKRPRFLTHDQLLREDRQRAATLSRAVDPQQAQIVLGPMLAGNIPPTMLPVALRNRFPQCVRSD